MTFLELCNAVRADANVQGTISTVTSQTQVFGSIVRWVQEAYLDIQAEHDNWKFLWMEDSITLPVGFRDVDFTTLNVAKTHNGTLRLDSNDKFLQRNDWVGFTRAYGKQTNVAPYIKSPTAYAVKPIGEEFIRLNSFIGVEDTLHFEATRTPYELVNNTDIPIWLGKWHNLIVFKALEKYAAYYNTPEIIGAKREALRTGSISFKNEYLPAMLFYTTPLV